MPRLTLPGAIESCVSEVPAPVRAAQLDEVRLATPGWQRSLWLCTQTCSLCTQTCSLCTQGCSLCT